MNEEQFLALLKSGVAPTDSCGKAAAAGPTTQPVSSGSASATDDPPAKRARTELAARANAEGILTFEYQNRYGYRRYSLSDGSHVEVKAADDARVPFKVQTQDTGETEIFIVVNDRLISLIETVEEFAKEQAIANSLEWFGRRIGQEEAETMLKTSLKRDALYPTKLKACTRRATIFAYTTREGETSSGQGAAFLDELVRASLFAGPRGERPALADDLGHEESVRRALLHPELESERTQGQRNREEEPIARTARRSAVCGRPERV